jgi:hypothetical protein
MDLASYIFKPRHGPELAMKVIERFCDDFLHYQHEGFYLHWRSSEGAKADGTIKYRPLPDGFLEFTVETEGGNMEAWTECCYDERELEASDLTDSFFALLSEDFWYTTDDGVTEYHFYERDLSELVSDLSDDDSRIVSFGTGRKAWVRGSKAEEKTYQTIDLLDYAMTVPIVNRKPQGEQLQLTL